MIQYKIYKDRALYPVRVIKTIIRYNLVNTPPSDDYYISYISKLAGIEIDTKHITGYYATPTRVRYFR